MRLAHNATPRNGPQVQFIMVGYVEIIERVGAMPEALLAQPRHVLDREERPVVDEYHVEETVADDSAGCALDDRREDREGGGRRVVRAVYEDVGGSAFSPVGGRRVDGLLDVGAVEVDVCAVGHVVEGAREAKDVPEEGAGRGYLVDVEAGVYEGRGAEDGVKDVAAGVVAFDIWGGGEGPFGWEDEVFVDEFGVAAVIGGGGYVGYEAVVEREEGAPVVDEGDGGNLLLDGIGAQGGVVD